MNDPELPSGAALEHVIAQVEQWTTPQIGQMLGHLRHAVEAGEAGPATLLAVDVFRQVLGQRKTAA